MLLSIQTSDNGLGWSSPLFSITLALRADARCWQCLVGSIGKIGETSLDLDDRNGHSSFS